MNLIFLAMVAVAFVTAAFRQLLGAGGDAQVMNAVAKAVVDDAGSAVTLALGLAGVMTLFLGLMKVAEAGGLLAIVARLLRPPMRRLFPGVAPDHPAMGAMILNISANVLGLGNAATPFGVRAMQHLDALNATKGAASDAMVLFLAINTASVTLLPTSVIALRAAAGSADPAGIVPTTLFATLMATGVAILLAKTCGRFWPPTASADTANSGPISSGPISSGPISPGPALAGPAAGDPASSASGADAEISLAAAPARALPSWAPALTIAAALVLMTLMVLYGRDAGPWILPGLVVGLLAFGAGRGVPVYEAFIEGARDGVPIALRIIPYLVAILVAVGMLRASGALDVLTPLGEATRHVGLPAEALLMGLLRTLSGSGAYGYLASVLNDPSIGPDSYTGYLLSTIQASTETTFYVLAVYFGAVGVRRFRHALFVGLASDAAGIVASAFICTVLHGS